MFKEFEELVVERVEVAIQTALARQEQKLIKPQGRYVKQKALMKELSLYHGDLMKLEAAGLRRIKIESEGRVVMYDRKNLDEVLERLAI